MIGPKWKPITPEFVLAGSDSAEPRGRHLQITNKLKALRFC